MAWGRQEGRRRWLGRRSPSTANQTEQVIFPVIIMAITRHEGLVMDLLILHALQRQPPSLSRGKTWWCVFFFFFLLGDSGKTCDGCWKGQQGILAFEGEVNEWTSLLRSIPGRPPGVCDVLPSVKLTHSPNITNIARHQLWGEGGCVN